MTLGPDGMWTRLSDDGTVGNLEDAGRRLRRGPQVASLRWRSAGRALGQSTSCRLACTMYKMRH